MLSIVWIQLQISLPDDLRKGLKHKPLGDETKKRLQRYLEVVLIHSTSVLKKQECFRQVSQAELLENIISPHDPHLFLSQVSLPNVLLEKLEFWQRFCQEVKKVWPKRGRTLLRWLVAGADPTKLKRCGLSRRSLLRYRHRLQEIYKRLLSEF